MRTRPVPATGGVHVKLFTPLAELSVCVRLSLFELWRATAQHARRQFQPKKRKQQTVDNNQPARSGLERQVDFEASHVSAGAVARRQQHAQELVRHVTHCVLVFVSRGAWQRRRKRTNARARTHDAPTAQKQRTMCTRAPVMNISLPGT